MSRCRNPRCGDWSDARVLCPSCRFAWSVGALLGGAIAGALARLLS